ncbi:pyranose dehydrogenase [Marasmius fiardii PR-910]|nr:pyranose dehydrogenase [Marasmius fiardii PR-910]
MPLLAGSLFLVFLVTSCFGAFFDDISALPRDTYDFVIVGGGTAGLVVANRLSENPKVSVLVIEAGVSDKDVLDIQVPFFCTRAGPRLAPYDWNYTTIPQKQLNGRILDYNRGYVLGGSSSTNYMIYTRGSSEDYDRIAKVTGDEGWSWKSLQPFILRNEMVTPPADHHNTQDQYNPAVHGDSGVNPGSLPGFPTPMDDRILETTRELSSEFPFNLDYNSGYQLGIGWGIATILNGARSSSSSSYLAPKYAKRTNLHVVLNSRVTRVLPSSDKSSRSCPAIDTITRESTSRVVSIDTVEVATSADSPRTTIKAKKEIILSAGSIGSPQILMNSGIGDSEDLNKHGIKPIVNNPSVGQNLSDHPVLGNHWLVNEKETFEKLVRNNTFADESLRLWKTKRRGPLVNTITTHLGWFRIDEGSSALREFADPAAGPSTAHYEFVFANGFRGLTPPVGNFLTIGTVVASPASRGSVRLRSNDPFEPPLMDPNFFSSEFDLTVMKEAIRSARRFVGAKAWEGYVVKPVFTAHTEEEIERMIRETSRSIQHPIGSAAMSAKSAGYGVVDPDLKVKGVFGVRVVDASVFPSAHTQVPVYIVAERGSQLIKDTWNL